MMATDDQTRGTLVSVERLGAHSALKLRIAQRAARIPKRFPVHHGIVLHRVTYWTELGGQPQLATGLLGIPRRHQARTSVMWLNGTNPTRSEAPSAGGLVGLLVAAVFAGSGHLLLAPDYIGLGTSDASARRERRSGCCRRVRPCFGGVPRSAAGAGVVLVRPGRLSRRVHDTTSA